MPVAMPQHPLFERYSVETIARRTGYTYMWVLSLKEGKDPISPKFRRKVSIILHKPEEELFLSIPEGQQDQVGEGVR